MNGQRVGSFDQNPERQLDRIEVDRVFTDKASGKDTHRPELDRLLAFLSEGDTVVVHGMDRLARNLDDLRRLADTLTRRGIRCNLSSGRIARILFCLSGGRMVLLHAFVKKTQKTPDRELDIAVNRMKGERND
jgi:DNA invertase Pin-like site-specific DNA recombinase